MRLSKLFRNATTRAVVPIALLSIAAGAMQPVYHIDRDRVFIPALGMALDTTDGTVAWRYPRFEGKTVSDGHGFLMISWLYSIQEALHARFTRICRLRTRDGKTEWCRDFPNVKEWAASANQQSVYVLSADGLKILDSEDGVTSINFNFAAGEEDTLWALPQGGALVLESQHGWTEALDYQDGSALLDKEKMPPSVNPIPGEGRGVMFYAANAGEFWLGSPLKALYRRAAEGVSRIPRVRVNDRGFLFAEWKGQSPVLCGGMYGDAMWTVPRGDSDPRLELVQDSALLMESAASTGSPAAGSVHMTGYDLSTGERRFQRTLPGGSLVLTGGGDALIVRSQSQLSLLDSKSGENRWQVEDCPGSLAAVSDDAILLWEDASHLVALTRENGDFLWRDKIGLPHS